MIRAKTLEWGDEDKNGGFYCNVKLGTGFEAYYDITQLEYGLAEVSYGIVCHEFGDKVIWRGPKGEAKAAAQNHADQVVRDMAQPVTPEDAARVLLEALRAADPDTWRRFWEGFDSNNMGYWQKVEAGLSAIATPPQENALQELADLGQEFDAAPQSGEGE